MRLGRKALRIILSLLACGATVVDQSAGYLPPSNPLLAGGSISPPPNAALNMRHVLFTLPVVPNAARYQLQIVVDNGDPDPFVNDPFFDEILSRPRRIVREGLAFGVSYAWRFRWIDAKGDPSQWSFTLRFSLPPLPPELASAANVFEPLPEKYQPGITLVNMMGVSGAPGFYGAAFDEAGDLVWYLQRDIWDIRMQRNGNVLVLQNNRARELTLDGTEVWVSHLGALDPHAAFEMPNGNVLAMRTQYTDVQVEDEVQSWRYQLLMELTRDGQTVWTWDPSENLSTEDFDPCAMQFQQPDGSYDWLHGNAVVYDAVDNAVYFSPRNISRIIKIDYATGQIIWSLGFDMPSGDVDFGDDLFSWQHAPEILPNGNVLLYDNGNRRGHSECLPENPYSAVVELSIDPQSSEPVEVVWEYLPEVFAAFFGDADRLANGNTLSTSGTWGRLDEVDAQGNLVWRLLLNTGDIYRAERIGSLYPLRGDADGDDDLDLLDFRGLQSCYAGTNMTAIHRTCLVHDFDEDGDVDHDDYAQFSDAVIGHGP